jgi:hypothetical protein
MGPAPLPSPTNAGAWWGLDPVEGSAGSTAAPRQAQARTRRQVGIEGLPDPADSHSSLVERAAGENSTMPRDASCGGRWIRELLRIEKRTSPYLVRYKLMEPIFGKESEKSKGKADREEKTAPHADTASRDAAPSAGGVEFGSALGTDHAPRALKRGAACREPSVPPLASWAAPRP